jgi:hypothetical protein
MAFEVWGGRLNIQQTGTMGVGGLWQLRLKVTVNFVGENILV